MRKQDVYNIVLIRFRSRKGPIKNLV